MRNEASELASRPRSAVGWFRELSPGERRTFWAAFGGFALDGMDILLYSFVVPTLITLWSMSRADAGLIATVALLVSAVGGWAGGILADRIGRVRTLQITILWFSVFTALSGLTNSFGQLLTVRALQGIGFGAEWAVGAALMGEMVRPQHRGKAVGFVQSSWAVGWAAAAILYAVTYALLPETVAWRVLFAIGLLPGLFVVYVRRNVQDSAVFARASHSESFLTIFRPGLLGTTLLGALLAAGVQGGYYAVMTWLPTYLKSSRHLSVIGSSGYLAVVIVAAWLGYVAGAYITDALGRRRSFLLFSVCSVATVILYTVLPISDPLMLVLGFPLGFFASGTYSGLGAYLAELFPTRVRGSGMGFTYNSGRAIGATFPALVGFLSDRVELGLAIALFTTCAYGLVWLALLPLPESNGRMLSD
ncbi:MAG: MFS transporter [Acetobacteraceae bacterium]|nr:MFS transporter [Acetobacteraceae bacterium]